MSEKAWFFEIRSCEGVMAPNFFGQIDFLPNDPEDEWSRFRVLGKNKNDSIDEMIAKLKSLKEQPLDNN